MTFDEYLETRWFSNPIYADACMAAKEVWDYQQQRIDELENWIISNWTDDVTDLYFFMDEKYTIGQLKHRFEQEKQ